MSYCAQDTPDLWLPPFALRNIPVCKINDVVLIAMASKRIKHDNNPSLKEHIV